MNIHGARRAGRRSQGVRRVWAGAGLQRAAYRGGGIYHGLPHSLFYRESWQNDIRSFRAMTTVALTVSFKLISFKKKTFVK